MLAVLTRAQLDRSVFPLGDSTKAQVRAEAAERGPGRRRQARLARHLLHRRRRHPGLPGRPARRGAGRHRRRAHRRRCSAPTPARTRYTVGQRKGLDLRRARRPDGRPRYVLSITPEDQHGDRRPGRGPGGRHGDGDRPVWTRRAPTARSSARCSCGRTASVVPAVVTVDDGGAARRPARAGPRGRGRPGHRRVPARPGRRRRARLGDHRPAAPSAEPVEPRDLTCPWPRGRGHRHRVAARHRHRRGASGSCFGELPDLPHLPELPDRGPGADMIGRSAGAPGRPAGASSTPAAGRSPPRPGRDLRRTADLLERDLDQLTEQARRVRRPVQGAGGRAVDARRRASTCRSAAGCCATRAPSATSPTRWPRGCAGTSPTCGSGCPGRRVLLQLDEPSLPAVLAGHVPTESGLERATGRSTGRTPRDRPADGRSRRSGCRWSCTAARPTCRWACPRRRRRRRRPRPRPGRDLDRWARRSRPASACSPPCRPCGTATGAATPGASSAFSSGRGFHRRPLRVRSSDRSELSD